jgi:hypothetical protein
MCANRGQLDGRHASPSPIRSKPVQTTLTAARTTCSRGTSGWSLHQIASPASPERRISAAITSATGSSVPAISSALGSCPSSAPSSSCAPPRTLLLHSGGVGVAGRLAEVHPRDVGMVLHVLRPRVDRARDPDGGGLVGQQVLAPHRQQLVARALVQVAMQRELRREVVVEHRRGHARAPADLVDRRAAVAALGEDLGLLPAR